MCCICFLMLVGWSNWSHCCGHWECQLGSYSHWLVNMTFWRSKHWRACSVSFSEVPVIIVTALKKQCWCSLPLSSLLFVLNCGVFYFVLVLLNYLLDSKFLKFGWFFSPCVYVFWFGFFELQLSFHNWNLLIRDWIVNVSGLEWCLVLDWASCFHSSRWWSQPDVVEQCHKGKRVHFLGETKNPFCDWGQMIHGKC